MSEYKTWLTAKAAKVAEGGVAEYLSWYIEHPSPLATGLFGRELTRPELVAKAVESAALSFKGTGVEVRHARETKEGWSSWTNVTTGTLGGLAFIVNGNTQQQGVVLQTEFHLAVIPVRSVIEMDNVI